MGCKRGFADRTETRYCFEAAVKKNNSAEIFSFSYFGFVAIESRKEEDAALPREPAQGCMMQNDNKSNTPCTIEKKLRRQR